MLSFYDWFFIVVWTIAFLPFLFFLVFEKSLDLDSLPRYQRIKELREEEEYHPK